ncbi:efflux RND transporter periplasmic adaptor subunit [Agaribacterium haliotis]|uniref:efflux RND transporter periplasmic adaptor subunit n=1 Tax=Agaribacterium haliotis TaxID=2013869 RepID=UPI000BB54110|nr:efflux RND transporter periplasmic adaptor subunit [Agaribacterium haliotis]
MNIAPAVKRFPVLIIVLVCAAIIVALSLFKPKAQRSQINKVSQVAVDIINIKQQRLNPKVSSYGRVEPRIESKLVAQVGGRIDFVSERFRDGGFFNEGELLLSIEAVDHEIEVEIAQANLAEAKRLVQEEQARARQAKEDWQRLGDNSEPSPLVLREPQLASAQANLKSASANLKKAELNLKRTQIRAPFAGRVLDTQVDLGQVVSVNTVLGELYASGAIEVRLPIKNSDLVLLELPEIYAHSRRESEQGPRVMLYSELAAHEQWQGYIVRTASSISDNSRQLYVVARIDDPFGEKAVGRFPLKIGQYVTAEIDAQALDQAIEIPNRAIYQGRYVYIFKDGAVYRRAISIRWQNNESAVIASGLEASEQLVVSPLGQIASGTPVKVISIDGVVQTEVQEQIREGRRDKQNSGSARRPEQAEAGA